MTENKNIYYITYQCMCDIKNTKILINTVLSTGKYCIDTQHDMVLVN